ncbi:transcriptional regulator GcvA [Phreatobacter stygius]|uniref:Transcriptional regulator GcvA n=1 Tax=Phreatobacter stygius TaxID=1940610 RepID=A0A4D7B0R3_9HYPH|nr:transcriptional regulator GcvA [Phreatobacter stygius]
MLRRSFLPGVGNLLAFEAAARHGSISRAAEELHLTQSAVSRQILHLEATLGVALFHRVRRRIVLTDAGRIYASDLRQALTGVSDATHKMMAYAGAGGVLDLAVLPTFAARWLIPRLSGFLSDNPDVIVNCTARVAPFDFGQEPFDAAIHVGRPDWAGAVCEHLMIEESVPVCSPGYRAAHTIEAPGDLTRTSLLQQMTRPTAWAEWFEQAGVEAPQALRGHRFEQFSMVAEAAVAGLGVALVPHILVEADLASGRLDVLFPQTLISTKAYYFVCPEHKAEAPLVRAFRDWIVGQAKEAGTSEPASLPV